VNDLQFLTGPSIGDIDPATPGEEIVSGTASHDLQAFTASGADVQGWPKLTGDWTVANPTLGSFGTLDTDPAARRTVVGLTRRGAILAYGTRAPACAAARGRASTTTTRTPGDARRDATLPGTPVRATLAAGSLEFTAPGDDGLCGRAAAYEVRTSDAAITPATFGRATPVRGTFPAAAPGDRARSSCRAGLRSVVAVRAIDDQGNVGPPRGRGHRRARCLPRTARFDRRGLRLRGGRSWSATACGTLVRRAGPPTRTRRGGVRRWCVRAAVT
jgi:hypothetical protein